MTNEKIFASEMIDMDQLDNISGGTVAEFNDIYNAFEKKVGTVGEVSNGDSRCRKSFNGGVAQHSCPAR